MNRSDASRPRILIADDDKHYLHAVSLRLEKAGYQVTQARDGQTAVELAGQSRPDLLILDVHMPGADGFSSLSVMDHHPGLRSVPVIYVTGDQTEETAVKAESHGALAVLRKPVDIEELLETIRLLIGWEEAGCMIQPPADAADARDVA